MENTVYTLKTMSRGWRNRISSLDIIQRSQRYS